MEVLILSRDNIHEVAKKTGRRLDELQIMYYVAQSRNEYVVFTIDIFEWRIEK